ncbi:2-dehydropantoate 2-reductase [Psychromonas sp. MB-3u-54]|uniref:ketopantoate reductase family protein n=1 Tax=Psychromonas sp. MB-3u-54 TaxID=2058319 RepID=UPI000C330257|nr:2-dehydropantoate 2-reductase [Psychromonas sp. MB-3u-54]PKH01486.1 2-dehydropantoate 2-reductase [Psychromonas sp. MB-3u-54]
MWQIIGAGAIGCLWAANLLRIGEKVQLITRSPCTANRLQYQDLLKQQFTFPVSTSRSLCSSSAPILVCVKATQVIPAITTHLTSIDAQQAIILMHNGMGCAEQVAKLLPDNPIICATTANASLLHSSLNIEQTGKGVTYLGAYNNNGKRFQSLQVPLNAALVDTCWCEDVNEKLWLKLIINMAINPLTAIHQIKNGQLKNPAFQTQINSLVDESLAVATAEGVTFKKEEILDIIQQVITLTAENLSSMNRDIFYRRHTENEFIAGYLLKSAAFKQIHTPTIMHLYQQIKALEQAAIVEQ